MEKRRPNYFIYLAAVFISLISFSMGTASSWTSPILPRFESNDSSINPIGRPLTISESGLVVSMINIGLLFGPCTSGFIVHRIGKKLTLLMFSIPIFVAHVLCCIATSYNIFLVARFLMGYTTGGAWPCLNGYLSEISEPKNRGAVNSLSLVAFAAGGLFSYLVGPFVSIKIFSIINLIPIALTFFLVYFFVPGSPYDLVMKKNIAAAEESLIKLRQTSDVKRELSEIEKTTERDLQNNAKIGDIFKDKASSRALFICGVLMIFNALSGNLVVVGYTQTIFDLAGSSIPSTYSAAMVGSVAVLATLANCQLTDRLGRKPIGIFSALAACISHISLVNLLCFSMGVAYSWTSPLLPRFESMDPNLNPISRPLTPSESGLLVSIINFGLLIAPAPSGFLVAKIGKKSTLLIFGLPIFVAHIMCSLATTYEVFLVARLLMGFTVGGASPLMNGYLSEISEPRNRGLLNSFGLVAFSSGGLFTYLVGNFVSVKLFSIINLIPVAITLIFVYFFVPDSPYDFVLKNDIQAAEISLIKLRRINDVKEELSEIERIVENSSKTHTRICDIFKNKVSSRALVICGSLMMFNALSGYLVVVGYTQPIIELAGGGIPSAYSAIIIGTVAVVATLCYSQLTDRLGRKPIIILSSILACISHVMLGLFFHLVSFGFDIGNSLRLLPVASIIIFMFSFNFGLASIPWVLLGELFASNIKPVASTICASINYVFVLILLLLYPYLVQGIGIANTFLFCASMLATCAIVCIIKLPETKGKTFEEIYILLSGENKRKRLKIQE